MRRRIGYMPERDCHLPGMTASAFVAFAGELSGLPRDEAISRAHEVLYYVGLGEARYRTVDTYSTGMKQRVKLAQALVHDPDLLLLDEPTNGLDPAGARGDARPHRATWRRRRQMSLVLCSHLLRDVERVCENVIVHEPGAGGRGGRDRRAHRARGARSTTCASRATPPAFLTDLKDKGCEWREGEDGYRVFLADGHGPRADLLAPPASAACRCAICGPAPESLEDVFLRALGHEVQA